MLKNLFSGFKKRIVKTAREEIRENFELIFDTDLFINDTPYFSAVVSLTIYDKLIFHQAIKFGVNDVIKITSGGTESLKNKAAK